MDAIIPKELWHGRLLESGLQPAFCSLRAVIQQTFQIGRGMIRLLGSPGWGSRSFIQVVLRSAESCAPASRAWRGREGWDVSVVQASHLLRAAGMAAPQYLVVASGRVSPDYSRIPIAKTNLQRKGTKSAEVLAFAFFAPLRCFVPLSLRGVLGKIAVTLSHQEHYGHRQQTHE